MAQVTLNSAAVRARTDAAVSCRSLRSRTIKQAQLQSRRNVQCAFWGKAKAEPKPAAEPQVTTAGNSLQSSPTQMHGSARKAPHGPPGPASLA